jgi:hypothetical protein
MVSGDFRAAFEAELYRQTAGRGKTGEAGRNLPGV